MMNYFIPAVVTSLVSVGAVAASPIITCDEAKPRLIRIPFGKVTVLNFPTTPKDAIPGDGGFDIKTNHQDLIIKAMRPQAATNLFVYLDSRRCFFHLRASAQGDEILFVRDPRDKEIEVQFAKP